MQEVVDNGKLVWVWGWSLTRRKLEDRLINTISNSYSLLACAHVFISSCFPCFHTCTDLNCFPSVAPSFVFFIQVSKNSPVCPLKHCYYSCVMLSVHFSQYFLLIRSAIQWRQQHSPQPHWHPWHQLSPRAWSRAAYLMWGTSRI